MKTILVIALLLSAAFAQTAKVVPLSPTDAAKAKQLHEAVKTAQKAQEDFDDVVYKTYVVELPPKLLAQASDMTWYTNKPGWENGFEYSEDFLFIVPKPSPISGSPIYYGSYGSSLPLTDFHCDKLGCSALSGTPRSQRRIAVETSPIKEAR